VFINATRLVYATMNSKLGRAENHCEISSPKYKLNPRVTNKKYMVLTQQAAGLLKKSKSTPVTGLDWPKGWIGV
jgi:hypothetical protein